MMLPVGDKDAEDRARDTDDKRAEERCDCAVHMEVIPSHPSEYGCKPEHDRIQHKCEQPERQDHERTSEGGQDRPDNGVDESENDGDDKQPPVGSGVADTIYEMNGRPQRSGGNEKSEQK